MDIQQICISKVLKFLLPLYLLSSCSFAQEFEVNNSDEFMNALSTANSLTNSAHRININSDVTLSSPISEAVSLELFGTDLENRNSLSLNGNIFTFKDAGNISKISNLKILSNLRYSSIAVTGQKLFIENSDFIGNSERGESILDLRAATVDIKNSSFSGNYSNNGGALIVRNSNVDILDTTISNNTAFVNGGGINISSGKVTINNSDISNNEANQGGAIYSSDKLDITNSTINENHSSVGGGALYLNKGTTVVDNTAFSKNYITSGALGGAIFNNGNLTIKNNSSFSDNKAEIGTGGAIANQGTLDISDTVFNENLAGNDGGAISNTGSLTIKDSSFIGNIAKTGNAGAIDSSNETNIINSTFDSNTSGYWGGAVSLLYSDSTITDCTFLNNKSSEDRGGALLIYGQNAEFNGTNIFTGNTAKTNGGAIYIAQDTNVKISGNAEFSNNKAQEGHGGALFVMGNLDINANNPDNSIIFSGNTDSTGSNAIHISKNPQEPEQIGVVNLNVSNGSKIVLADNISGLEGTKLNINGTSSHNDNVYIGSANKEFYGDINTNNINLHFYNEMSGLENAFITAANTNFDFINGSINNTSLNLNLMGNSNSLCIDVDPALQLADYIDIKSDLSNQPHLAIRGINVLSQPTQTTIFDLYDHEKYGTDLELAPEIENSTVYGALKTYKWALTPKLTLIEIGGLNPNIQRYQAATGAAFMNQMLSYDYSLNRTDEIYTNLREQKLALRKLNSYASIGNLGRYMDYYYEDGSAIWIRPYVNLETFHLSGAADGIINQSYGTMLGFDFPMKKTRNDWILVPTIYGSYLGSSQQFLESRMNQNGGYGGFLLSAYKDNFYTGWTINGGGLGVHSRYNGGSDNYGIVTAGTALKLAYNWKIFNRLIVQPNFTTAYTFLSPSNLVNFQNVTMDQSQVNGLTIAPSMRITYRNETGFEPYIYGGCVIPLMSDIKAYGDGLQLDTLTLNAWAQFGAGVRKRITDRITCFLDTVIRTGGRDGWGFMFNIQIAI